MVNKPLIRPYFWGGGSFGGGPARIPMKIYVVCPCLSHFSPSWDLELPTRKCHIHCHRIHGDESGISIYMKTITNQPFMSMG